MRERFLRNKQIVMHYYIATAMIILFFMFVSRGTPLLDREITLILMGYLLFFPIVILYTRKYAVHIFLFVLALITGFYSFYHYAVEEHSILNALYFTFQLYLLTLTDVFTEDGSALLQYPLIVEIARWSAALYTISTVFIAMYRMLEMSIILTFYQVFGKHIVVFGYNDRTLGYVEHLRKKKERVVLIAEQVPIETVDYLEGLKIVVLNLREDSSEVYTKAALARAKALMLMYEADMDNLNTYIEIYDYFKMKNIHREQLTVSIQLQSYTSAKLLQDVAHLKEKEEPYFTIRFMNPYERLVENMFERYPISMAQLSGEKAYVFIIGFAELGQQIARQILINQQQTDDQSLTIKIVDPHMSRAKKAWDNSYGKEFPQAQLAFQQFDVMQESLENLIQQAEKDITHIYACLPEEHLDLWAVIELSNQFPHIPIYMSFSKDGIAAKWIQSEVSGDRLIYRISTYEDLLEDGCE